MAGVVVDTPTARRFAPQSKALPLRPRLGGTASEDLTSAERDAVRLITYAMVITILTQRVITPGGVPVAIPVMYVLVIVMWRRGLVRIDPLRWFLYLVAMAVSGIAATLSSFMAANSPSINSIGLLVVVYVPLCWVVQGDPKRLNRAVMDRFVRLMTVIAVVTLVEWGAQVLGWTHVDFLKDLVPSNLLASNFNTNYPVEYGSAVLKPNAFVFLEPSVLSQFLALGILGQLIVKMRWIRLTLLGLALLSTVSGTGIIILLVGLLAVAVARGIQFTVIAALVTAAVIVILPFTPAGSLFGERATETSSQGSSGNLRFVAPYQRLYDVTLQRDLATNLVGQGPGAGDRAATRYFEETSLPLISPTVPKLVVEYGIPAAVAFMWFFLTTLFSKPPSVPFAVALFVLYAVLQGALLLPVMPYTCMLLSTLYSGPAGPLPVSRRIYTRRLRRA